jgi:SAM-dependent methyltransferase
MFPDSSFLAICPICQSSLVARSADDLCCPADGQTYQCIDGIWPMLPPDRAVYYARFMRDYEAIRQSEGRGGADSAAYRALPYSVTGRWAANWAIRALSYETLIERVIMPSEAGAPLSIIDVGAGSGWLSNRLAARGHQLAAVDLQLNAFDGLGAFTHYEHSFLPVQAEFDHLPFETESIDLVIFNASLHYSEDYAVTLSEALRVLHPDGQTVILDTPVYHDAASGERMAVERQQHFQEVYGFASDALASENYLTHDRLRQLGAMLGIRWQFHRARYGWRWGLRRLIGRIRTRREPAEFYVISGKRE